MIEYIYPKISVVCITWGHQDYIIQAIKGVLIQSYCGQIELIVSNDNSPDNTDSIVNKFLEEETIPQNIEIKYSKQPHNMGMMPNFIWALQQCTGVYIALCEGDDYWVDPNKLQRQVDFLEKNEEYILCFHRCLFLSSVNGKSVFTEQSLSDIKYEYTMSNLLDYWNIATASMVFRNIFVGFEFLDWMYKVASGDIMLASLLFKYGKFFLLEDCVMSVYRINVGVSLLHKEFKMIDYRTYLYYNINHYYHCRYEKEIYTALYNVINRYSDIPASQDGSLLITTPMIALVKAIFLKIKRRVLFK